MTLTENNFLKTAVFISVFVFSLSSSNILFSQFPPPYKVEVKNRTERGKSEVKIDFIFKIPDNIHVYSSKKNLFKIEEKEVQGLGQSDILMPELYDFKNFDGTVVKVLKGNCTVTLRKAITAESGEKWTISGYIQSQGCDDSICFAPLIKNFSFSGTAGAETKLSGISEKKKQISEKSDAAVNSSISNDTDRVIEKLKKFRIVDTAAGYMKTDDFLKFLSGDSEDSNILEGKGFIAVIIIVLIGGIALNLTPCVLPMIPVNLAIIGSGHSADSKWSGFLRALIYALGIALSYGVLGLLAVLGGAKFGTLNSTWWFNIIVAVIFIILALAMLDVFIIDFSKFSSKMGNTGAEKGKILGIFFLGILSALLAGACVAPVLISVLLYSTSLYAEGDFYGLFLPFLLGIGMAVPWPVAGAGISIMPKPGRWMEWIKRIFAVFIFLMAAYYAWIGIGIIRNDISKGKSTVESEANKQLNTALEKSLTEKKPVFIDFWATWCKNCSKMEKNTFKASEVADELSNFIMVKYQSESMNNPDILPILNYFNVKGLPTYVILEPEKQHEK